jgi:hypothetical protein
MYRLALTMLVNERGKYLGIIAALSFTVNRAGIAGGHFV